MTDSVVDAVADLIKHQDTMYDELVKIIKEYQRIVKEYEMLMPDALMYRRCVDIPSRENVEVVKK